MRDADSHSPAGGRAYNALLPLVDTLVQSGNLPIDGGFLNSPGGWYCRVRDPINFELLRSVASIPPDIELHDDGDTVLDRSTWAAILGPGADGY